MKKILLVLSLSLLFVLPGCSLGGSSSCNINQAQPFTTPLVPGQTYLINYKSAIPPIMLYRVANSNGYISAPSYGYSCYSLAVIPLTNSNLALTASPSSVYLPSPPATATITGQGFDTTYGMPKVEYFDNSGYLVGSVYATSVASDGTSLQANMPDLSNVYSGSYQVKVTNKTSDGYYAHIVGSAPMTGWGRDRPDSDGDGWYDDEDCDPYDPFIHSECSGNGGCYTGPSGELICY